MDPTPPASPFGPIAGLRVLDLGNMIAGPIAASFLADFGADVLKVEHPELGDDIRNWPPIKEGRSLWWKVIARNKKLITLNLSRPEGRALLRRLLPDFDVLIENFRPGTMERWGLGYAELARVNRRLVMVRVSGYGQTGPYAPRPGYGTVAEAMSGVPSFTGFPDKPPTLSAFPLVDYLTGLFAAYATLLAVYERDVRGSGVGQVIDASLYESMFRIVEAQVIGFDQLGVVKTRRGNRMDEDSPRNAYRTADGEHVTISIGSQRIFTRLAQAIGRPELADDPRFGSLSRRVENGDELDAMLVEWFAGLPLTEAMRRLETADVVAGPVYDIRRIVADPHYAAREDIVAVPDPDFGSVRMPAVVPKLSRTPGRVVHPGLDRGAHNDEVYRGRLGLSAEECERLRRAGVI
ncbi:MAG TPA: CoA transferase [Methylomirabilota bacterium]|nr:CoA transferase [Methylomirabilota bacterium]